MNGGYGHPRPAGGFELYSWLFMRISGLLLIFLALGHLFIMHILVGIENVDYSFVAQRYATPFWRTYDLLMLLLALFHGLNGARILIDDYVRTPGWRVFWITILYVVALVFTVIGSLIILTFQPKF